MVHVPFQENICSTKKGQELQGDCVNHWQRTKKNESRHNNNSSGVVVNSK